MIQKVLLINPPFQEDVFYKNGFFAKKKQAPLFPFGIAYIASYLRKLGYDVEILDIFANLLREEEVIEELKKRTFDMVGISALVTQYRYVRSLVGTIKEMKNVPIILGSGLATSCHRLVLEKVPAIDICVRGEGEITLKEIIEDKDNLHDVSGISFRDKDGKVVVNPDRLPHENIDEFPWPAYELFDVPLYLGSRIYETGILDIREKYLDKKIFPAVTSRGCPYNCRFCGKIIPTGRLRSVDDVIKEIKYIKDTYDIDGVHFIDELFVVSKERAIELSRALKPLNLFWDCQARCNTIDYETLKIMKDAGCVAIGLGIESGSQKILDNMNKKITVRQIEDAMMAAKKVGCPVKVQLIFGYPGEDYETLGETVSLFKRVGHPGRSMAPIVPIPGTKVFEYTKDKGLIRDDEQFVGEMGGYFSDRASCTFNLTNLQHLSIEELGALKKKSEEKMIDNYLLHVFRHPIMLAKALRYEAFRSVLLIRTLKKLRIYNLIREIKKRLITLPW